MVPTKRARSNPLSRRPLLPHRPSNDRPHRRRALHLERNVHDKHLPAPTSHHKRRAHQLVRLIFRQFRRNAVLHGYNHRVWRRAMDIPQGRDGEFRSAEGANAWVAKIFLRGIGANWLVCLAVFLLSLRARFPVRVSQYGFLLPRSLLLA